jgi:hypothetical protein
MAALFAKLGSLASKIKSPAKSTKKVNTPDKPDATTAVVPPKSGTMGKLTGNLGNLAMAGGVLGLGLGGGEVLGGGAANAVGSVTSGSTFYIIVGIIGLFLLYKIMG